VSTSHDRWCGEFIAWANNIGVKIYDCNLKQRITHISRPQESLSAAAEDYRCNLCWADPRTLCAFCHAAPALDRGGLHWGCYGAARIGVG
jgi:hypothetical protein